MGTLTYSGALEVETCWCGIRHAIPKELARQADMHGKAVYCPLGHQWVVRKTEVDKLRAELDQAQADARWQRDRAERNHAEAEHQASRANGYKGALTKVKKRIGNGVCPCCNRHFANVERHMANQHPSFGQPEGKP